MAGEKREERLGGAAPGCVGAACGSMAEVWAAAGSCVAEEGGGSEAKKAVLGGRMGRQ